MDPVKKTKLELQCSLARVNKNNSRFEKAVNRWRNVRYSVAGGLAAIALTGCMYVMSEQAPIAPQEYTQWREACQTLEWIEQKHEGARTGNANLDRIAATFTDSDEYISMKSEVEKEVSRLAFSPVVMEHRKAIGAYEDNVTKKFFITIPLLCLGAGLMLRTYFKEENKYVSSVQSLIEENYQSMNDSLKRIFDNIDVIKAK